MKSAKEWEKELFQDRLCSHYPEKMRFAEECNQCVIDVFQACQQDAILAAAQIVLLHDESMGITTGNTFRDIARKIRALVKL